MMPSDSRLEQAKHLYERAVFAGDATALDVADRELDGVEADLALARGRVVHARFLEAHQEDPREQELFDRSARLYRALGDTAGEAEALFWLGIFQQVVRGDDATALPLFERAHELATQAGDTLIQSYTSRHIGFAVGNAGDLDAAKERLEQSLRLRREIGFTQGVAAAQLALAELAARQGRRADAAALLDEAEATAIASGARGVQRWITATRAELTSSA